MEYVGISETGLVREMNQDAILMHADACTGLFAVADGMGGHSHGEWASRRIIMKLEVWWKQFRAALYEYDFRRMTVSIKQAVEQANREIYTNYNRMAICGSTIAVLFLYQNQYCILYAGDSRVYQYLGNELILLTIDETWENQAGLSPEERKDFLNPNYGKLVNAIGTRETMRCRILTGMWEDDNSFLLCTDGLYKFCTNKELKYYMKKSRKADNLGNICNQIRDTVYRNGAGDNVSYIIVR